MVVDALAAPLLRVELFLGLKSVQLTKIGRMAERVIYKPGDAITRAGEAADAAILIVAGSAEWVEGSTIEAIETGSLIGEMAMFVDHVYGATIIARSQLRCLRLTRQAMHKLLLEDPAIGEHITSQISARLTRVVHELREIDSNIPGLSDGLPESIVLANPASHSAVTARSLAH